MKRIVLFDVSGSVVTESRIFDRAYAALMSIFAEHFKDEIIVLAFSEMTIEVEDLADLRLGQLRGFGGGSNLEGAMRFAAAYQPDAVSIITDDTPGYHDGATPETPVDVHFLTTRGDVVPPELVALVSRAGGSICQA